MSKRVQESGHAKRLKTRKKEEDFKKEVSKMRKLDSFIIPKTGSQSQHENASPAVVLSDIDSSSTSSKLIETNPPLTVMSTNVKKTSPTLTVITTEAKSSVSEPTSIEINQTSMSSCILELSTSIHNQQQMIESEIQEVELNYSLQPTFAGDASLFVSTEETTNINIPNETAAPSMEYDVSVDQSAMEVYVNSSFTQPELSTNILENDPVKYVNMKTFPAEILNKFLSLGPCQPTVRDLPKGEFPKNKQGRSFSENFYYTKLPDGSFCQRLWLNYSPELDKIFCSSCIFFSKPSSKYYPFIKSGSNNWANMVQLVKSHEQLREHLDSEILRSIYISSLQRIDWQLQESRNADVSRNREVVKILLNIIYFLAKHNLALRGKQETMALAKKENLGNFIDLALLLSKYHPILATFMQKLQASSSEESSKRVARVTFLSNRMQNTMLTILAQNIRLQILEEVKTAKYFSVIIDTTTDISKQEQFCMVLRYVRIKAQQVEIVERLVALDICTNATGQGMYELFTKLCEKHNIEWRKYLIGQAYDGAQSMRGQYNGLRTLIQRENPRAVYIWCYAHLLNLIVVDVCDDIAETKNFFGVLQSIVGFMRRSRKRMQIFKDIQESDKSTGKISRVLTLPGFSNTRWTSHDRTIVCIHDRYDQLIESLEEIRKTDEDREAVFHAGAFLNNLNSYEFVLLLTIMQELFKYTTPLTKYFQTKNIDFIKALRFIEKTTNDLKSLRNEENYELFLKRATDFAKKHNTSSNFPQKRISKRKVYLAEKTTKDERPVEEKIRFRIEVYYPIMDLIIKEFQDRFSSNMLDIVKDCTFLSEQRLKTILTESTQSTNESYAVFDSIRNWLELDISLEDLQTEFKMFTTYLPTLKDKTDLSFLRGDKKLENEEEIDIDKESDEEEEKNEDELDQSLSPLEILQLICRYDLQSTFPNVFIIYKAACTLPITSASAERAFSKVKIIKSKLRSTMGEERLEDLMMISCEGVTELTEIQAEAAINRLSETSEDMGRLLCYK